MTRTGQSKRKKIGITLLLILIFIIGLGLILYPTVSNWWNTLHATRAIETYAETVAQINSETYDVMWEEAEAYNRQIGETGVQWTLSDAQYARYESILDVTGTGIMGYLEIGQINVRLPVYHGTEESALQAGVGHIAGSSLPVGGESSHCILSSHTGLPSARLFTDLDKLREGDLFRICTLDETLTYEVDQIRIVLPHELDDLKIEQGKDLCTLVTCTPYGVNTHRLLVRGHRIEEGQQPVQVRVTGDALRIDPLTVAPVLALILLVMLLVCIFVMSDRKRKMRRKEGKTDEEALP